MRDVEQAAIRMRAYTQTKFNQHSEIVKESRVIATLYLLLSDD